MYTPPFRYVRASTLAEAESLFSAAADPRYLAGGQTLIPAMKQRLAAPSDLIDIAGIPGLHFIRAGKDRIVIGAATCHADVAASDDVQAAVPALARLASAIGDPAVRHKGSLGGSLANNDPAADYPAAVLALGASITTTRRTIPAEAFFTGLFATALEPGEIVTEVAFPIPKRAGYAKFAHPASRYALVGVFVAETFDGVRVAVTGAGPGVFRAPLIEAALTVDFSANAAAAPVSAEGLNSDLFASAEYRAHLISVMAKRAVAAASMV